MDASNEIVSVFKSALPHLLKIRSPRIKERWLTLMNRQIRIYIKLLKTDISNGQKHQIEANIGHLKRFKTLANLHRIGGGHISREHKRSDRIRWEDIQSAFRCRLRTGIVINLRHVNLKSFFDDAWYMLKARIRNALKKTPLIKVSTLFRGEFLRKCGDVEIIEEKHFPTKNQLIDAGTDLKNWFKLLIESIMKKLEDFQEKDSGFALRSISGLEVNINQAGISTGAGTSFIQLPTEIINKKACINVKNKDHLCFMWSLVAGLYPKSLHSDRTTSYPHPKTVFDYSDIDFPMHLRDITKFEQKNNISVNIYSLEKCKKHKFTVVPSRITLNKIPTRHFNLLLIQNEYFSENDIDERTDADIQYHYVLIKSMSRLIASQVSRSKKIIFICDNCLNYFHSDEKLKEHEILCGTNKPCRVLFPAKSHIEFTNYRYKQECPFVIYGDVESYLKPITNETSTKTRKYQEHIPISIGFYLKSRYEQVVPSKYESYTGLDCMEWFSKKLREIADMLYGIIKNVQPMIIEDFEENNLCHICEKPLHQNDITVIDHDHFTGVIRGRTHQSCNLNFKKSFIIPLIFHNFSGYDAHFIIKELAKTGRIYLLPSNKEKYISFTKSDEETEIQFRFIDSLRFMDSSLEKLASYLSPQQFIELGKHFPQSQLSLLKRKGVFPYDYFDSPEKLRENQLPPASAFYNKLTDKDISEEDYLHAQTVWNNFKMENFSDYVELYMKTDILLLADVFEQFRMSCLMEYKLDPAWYYTLPGFTWDCMLKHTQVKLELMKDIDMLLFVEKGIRGGISQCSGRYSKANNKYMKEEFNPEEDEKYLFYCDVNNLYGWAMSQYLPHGGFEWVDTNIDLTQIEDDSPIGYVAEVDLEYPEEIHDRHRDLPFCAENRAPPGAKLSKLLTTLHKKERYIIHYRNLKQALEHGLKLTKIHRILKFDQGPWLRTYIEKNTILRSKAKNDFEKNMFKLMNNAVFGKTMENIRKHRIVKIRSKWDGRYGVKNLVSSPTFKSYTVFGDDLVAIELSKNKIVFDKPVYIGMAILDISKVCLYEFHYDYILPNFIECKLNYMDTDGLIYEFRNQDPYEIIKRDCLQRFDTSDYAPDNSYGIPRVNKKVIGLMKDELNGSIMLEFIGLRSKMYSYRVESKAETKKAKGISRSSLKEISFHDYKTCLFDAEMKIVQQRNIVSNAHNLFSVEQTKLALSHLDNKRFILSNNIDTVPWGHYTLNDN